MTGVPHAGGRKICHWLRELLLNWDNSVVRCPKPSNGFNMALTEENIARIRANWAVAAAAPEAVAQNFYATLFRDDPSTRPLFTNDMVVQGQKLVDTLGFIVDHLDNMRTLQPAAQDLAKRHVAYGVEPAHYGSVGAALIATLDQMLGDRFTAADQEAWASVYSELSTLMITSAYPLV